MKAKDNASERKKKLIYFIDETIVFVTMVFAVIFSEVMPRIIKSGVINSGDFNLSWNKLLISSFIAIIIYGSTNSSFKYSDINKPPMMKRIYSSLMAGLAWKSIIGMLG